MVFWMYFRVETKSARVSGKSRSLEETVQMLRTAKTEPTSFRRVWGRGDRVEFDTYGLQPQVQIIKTAIPEV